MVDDATPRMSHEEYKNRASGGGFGQMSLEEMKRERSVNTPEHEHQKAIFGWAEALRQNHDELHMLFAIPNGQYRDGQRMEAGLKSGVPDMMLAVPRNGHAGLFIELKRGDRKPTMNQRVWIKRLRAANFRVEVCYGSTEAIKTIIDYLDLPIDD